MLRRLGILLAATLLTVGVAVASCSGGDDGVTLHTFGHQDDGAAVAEGGGGLARTVPGARLVTFLLPMPLCVEGGGRAEVRSVEPLDPIGPPTIADVGIVRVHDDGRIPNGMSSRPLREEHPDAGRVVTTRCGADLSEPGADQELVVELHRDGPGTHRVGGLRVHYRAGGQDRVLDLGMDLALCDETCDPELGVSGP